MTLKLLAINKEQLTDKNRYNTNNHHDIDWTYGHIISIDEYEQLMSHSYRDKWAHLQKVDGIITHEFTKAEVKILCETRSALYTGKRPGSLKEELDDIESRMPDLTNNQYFCRLNQCSPKDGLYKEGPFTDNAKALDSIISSLRSNKELERCKKAESGNLVYFIPWRTEWKNWFEFRVFVYHNKVTAISQYNWSRNLGLVNYPLQQWGKNIIEFCEKIVIEMPNTTEGNWVIDVIVDPNTNNVELVEFNCFGAELAAGSALFGWIQDRDILYSNGSIVEFHYLVD